VVQNVTQQEATLFRKTKSVHEFKG